MSTDTSTPHSMSPTPGRGSHQSPPNRWRRTALIVLIVAVVLLAAGGLGWQFFVSPQLGCRQAADPTRTGAVSEYCLSTRLAPPNYGAMTVGPDGNLWMTDYVAGKIARITSQGVITEFAVSPAPTAIPLPGIARGPDGNLWFIAGTQLGRISPQGRVVAAVAMPSRVHYITGLTAASDGALWVGLSTSKTDPLTHEIGRVTASGAVTTFALRKPVTPTPTGGLYAGADGNLWVGVDDLNIVRITPTGQLTEFAVAVKHPPLWQITPGPDGNIWFIDSGGDVGRMTPTGEFKVLLAVEQANDGMPSIGAGPDGNVWLSAEPGVIRRITPSGVVTTFQLPHQGDVTAITAGSDGGVWFVLASRDLPGSFLQSTRVVRITP